MSKTRKRSLALLVVLAMLATLFMMPGTASAAATYGVSSVAQVSSGTNNFSPPLYLQVTMDTATALISAGSYVYFDLPSSPAGFALTLGTSSQYVFNGAFVGSTVGTDVYVSTTNSNRTIRLQIASVANPSTTATTSSINIPIVSLTVPSGYNGEVNLYANAPYGSIFSSGSFPIAVAGTGKVQLAVESVEDISTAANRPIGVIQIKESMAAALADSSTGTAALTFKLPAGFTWSSAQTTLVWGDSKLATSSLNPSQAPTNTAYFTTSDSGRKLEYHVPTGARSTSATFVKLVATVTPDESVAKTGDVEVVIGGNSTYEPSSLIVAKLGDYGVKVSSFGEPKTVRAGRTDEEIGKFAIEETLPGSLIKDRTITLQLTGGAIWRTYPNISSSDSVNPAFSSFSWSQVGDNRDTIKANVPTATSTNAAKYVLSNGTIDVSAAAGNEIKVIVGGSAGASGEVVVAKVVKPVTVKVEKPATVVAGAANQAVSDIIIEENMKEAIATGTFYPAGGTPGETNNPTGGLFIEFPAGVFPSLPKIEVVEGDLVINKDSIARGVSLDGRWVVGVSVTATSSVPSKVKISGLTLKVDRSVAEGPISVAVKGSLNAAAAYFSGYTSVASGVIANVVTPAPGEQKATASFVIGSTTYKVNGVEYTMDVAPYIKDDRTFMPLRYVGMSLGVAEQNILWDDAAKTATLMKGDKVVQVKIGSTALLVNGVTINMDVAPEIKDGRTMMPLRFIAQAFGAKLTWDDATKTASFEL